MINTGKAKLDLAEKNTVNIYKVYGGNGVIGYTSKFKNKGPGIIIGRVGAYAGNVYFIKKDEGFNFTDNALFLYSKSINLKYLFYYLKINPLRNYLIGSSQPLITQSIINSLQINLPSLKQQQEIIDIIKPVEDMINNINMQIKQMKNMLIKQYELLDSERKLLSNYINMHTNNYDGQDKYLATNAVAEFELDKSKIQDIKENRPSRANLTPRSNSLIISKLDGENKILYIDEEFESVISTGFFNFSSKHVDHVVGFILSDDFKKQKSLLSTGTTMVGLNNNTLSKVQIKSSDIANNHIVLKLNNLIKVKEQLNNQLNNMISVLIK